ncbi:P-loop containing nucleoside triphosphate hydrolase protein [Coprinopsis marcescibilis]|uniref:P-loop containing nucleoside triphosphate hydrolase protein n=1 Tax=Coprinopsis marcescibilis TaxID=230819 RepID=A0A5C3KV32_COPMA|nr:P-loop containing nucleoside triphosphate hydrolase protein [Coprinopsis marcescibilis]
MNTEAHNLAQYLVERLQSLPSPKRLIVGLSGIPGSGKSTLAQLIVGYVNDILRAMKSDGNEINDDGACAVVVGLDGWHLTRTQLDAFLDPGLAHARRGAHWTFDGSGYVQFVTSLRSEGQTTVVFAPSFDHAVKDPVQDSISILPTQRIVLIEGLYAFLSIEPWQAASSLLDERWWLQIDESEARKRLAKRHVVSGIVDDEEAALHRADHNDLPNGRFIQENMLPPTKVIGQAASGT